MRHTKSADVQAQISLLTRHFTLLTIEMNNLPAQPHSRPRVTTIQNELRAIKGQIRELNAKLSKISYDRDCC